MLGENEETSHLYVSQLLIDPDWPHRCIHEAAPSDELNLSPDYGAKDCVLRKARSRRAGDRADNGQQGAGPDRCDPKRPRNGCPSIGLRVLEGSNPRPTDYESAALTN